MPRSQSITQARFDDVELPLVISLRLGRSTTPKPLAGDGGIFATSVQLGQATTTAELHMRDVAAAEMLVLGAQGDLVFCTGASEHDRGGRQGIVHGAVLYAVELQYEQAAPASAVLRFLAESGSSTQDPFVAEEQSA